MKITINIFTLIFYVIIILSGYINYLIIYFLIMFFHELGHIIAIKLFKLQINKITILPSGGVIDTNIGINIHPIKQLIISISGILMQLTLFLLVPNNSYNLSIFYQLNIAIIIFNILPIYPLDGYKILLSLIEYFYKYRIILVISYIISMIFLLFLFSYTKNLYIFVFLYILNIKYILNYPYYYNKFILERYLYKTNYKKIKIINSIRDFYKCCNNHMKVGEYLISEEKILNSKFN